MKDTNKNDKKSDHPATGPLAPNDGERITQIAHEDEPWTDEDQKFVKKRCPLLAFGTDVIDKEYRIIPLQHKKKAPFIKDWPSLRIDSYDDLKKWVTDGTLWYGDNRPIGAYPWPWLGAGFGIMTGSASLREDHVLVGVDLDIRDEPLCREMFNTLKEMLGVTVLIERIGHAPKTLVPLRVKAEAFSKDSSALFVSTDERGNTLEHQIEILGNGNQFVACGVHPNTGKAYEWREGSPMNEPIDQLPVITLEQLDTLFKTFADKCKARGWTQKTSGKRAHNEGGGTKGQRKNGPDELRGYPGAFGRVRGGSVAALHTLIEETEQFERVGERWRRIDSDGAPGVSINEENLIIHVNHSGCAHTGTFNAFQFWGRYTFDPDGTQTEKDELDGVEYSKHRWYLHAVEWCKNDPSIEAAAVRAEYESSSERAGFTDASEGWLPPKFKIENDCLKAEVPREGGEGKDDIELIYLAGAMWHEGYAVTGEGDKTFAGIGFVDRSGKQCRVDLPMSLVMGQPRHLIAELADHNLHTTPHSKLYPYLQAFINSNPPYSQKTAVSTTGWHNTSFVLPTETLGDSDAVFQQDDSTLSSLVAAQGTVDDWTNNVGRLCLGNSRLMFAVSAAFAAPLLKPADMRNGMGFHFWGESSSGKTHTLYSATSVFGPTARLMTWRTTDNAIEITAKRHNDMLLCLDEIKDTNIRDIGNTAYMLANGGGKNRAVRTGTATHLQNTWQLLYLSSGEHTLKDQIQIQGGGAPRDAHTGQAVRLVDIEADAGVGLGVFEELHGNPSGQALTDQLREATAKYYGAVGRAYLLRVVEERELLAKRFKTYKTHFFDQTGCNAADVGSQVVRVAEYFALIGFAGMVASRWGMTGWEQVDKTSPHPATTVAMQLFKDWAGLWGWTGNREHRRGVLRVSEFIQQHADVRFIQLMEEFSPIDEKPLSDSGEDDSDNHIVEQVNRMPYKPAGYVDTVNGETVYFIFPAVFRDEVCRGLTDSSVCKGLDERGYLLKDRQRRQYSKKVKGEKQRFYAIRSAVLEVSDDTVDNTFERGDF